jgi:hypothetical protein
MMKHLLAKMDTKQAEMDASQEWMIPKMDAHQEKGLLARENGVLSSKDGGHVFGGKSRGNRIRCRA